MNVLRFIGKNSRDALNKVREALGEDAIIVSNRTVNGGNEIMAYQEETPVNAAATAIAQAKPVVVHEAIEDSGPISLLSHINNKNRERDAEAAFARNREAMLALLGTEQALRVAPVEIETVKPVMVEIETVKAETTETVEPEMLEPVPQIKLNQENLNQSNLNQNNSNQEMAAMLAEMREMRNTLEAQLSALSWSNSLQRDPVQSSALCSLLATGFSTTLSKKLTEKIPPALTQDNIPIWIKAVLSQKLSIAEDESEILDKGGIFALVGPTGVGKTTTTAKLAARYVMKNGTENLGLITTDAYRIGGYEQLRIYGKILGVMVYAVKDQADLNIALNELKHKHTILIDTVGVSQRSEMVTEQMDMLSDTTKPIKKLLCLNATSTGETLNDVVRAYKGADEGIDGCIITKLDEALSIGSALDVIIQHGLKLYYTTNGQRVPEDIHLANKKYLIANALALASGKNRAFELTEEDLAYVLANTENETINEIRNQSANTGFRPHGSKEQGYA